MGAVGSGFRMLNKIFILNNYIFEEATKESTKSFHMSLTQLLLLLLSYYVKFTTIKEQTLVQSY